MDPITILVHVTVIAEFNKNMKRCNLNRKYSGFSAGGAHRFRVNRLDTGLKIPLHKCQAQPVWQHVFQTKETCQVPSSPAARQKDCTSYINRKEFLT